MGNGAEDEDESEDQEADTTDEETEDSESTEDESEEKSEDESEDTSMLQADDAGGVEDADKASLDAENCAAPWEIIQSRSISPNRRPPSLARPSAGCLVR